MFLLALGENSTVVKILNLEVYRLQEQGKAENYLGEDNETWFEKEKKNRWKLIPSTFQV